MSTPGDWDTTGPTRAEKDQPPPELRYSGVEAWVTGHLLPTYLRLDATTGMSVWWRDHADHHLPILLSPDGPFARCAARAHQSPPDPLPTDPAPPDWWVQRPDA